MEKEMRKPRKSALRRCTQCLDYRKHVMRKDERTGKVSYRTYCVKKDWVNRNPNRPSTCGRYLSIVGNLRLDDFVMTMTERTIVRHGSTKNDIIR